MSMFRPQVWRKGGEFLVGVAGGMAGVGTGRPTGAGAAGEVVGRAGRQKIEEYKRGAQFGTHQQIARTQHFASTGQQTP
jgi:hypothetical protein